MRSPLPESNPLMSPRFALVLALAAFTPACTTETIVEASEYDPLYQHQPGGGSSVDTNALYGLWETSLTNISAGVTLRSHVRLSIRDGEIRFANRCSADGYETVTVGITVNTTLVDEQLSIPDRGGSASKEMEGPSGSPTATCIASITGPGTVEYALGAGQLQAFGIAFDKVTD